MRGCVSPYGCDLLFHTCTLTHILFCSAWWFSCVHVDKKYFSLCQNLSGGGLRPVIKCNVISFCLSYWFKTDNLLEGPSTWKNVLLKVIFLISCNILHVIWTSSMWVCPVKLFIQYITLLRSGVQVAWGGEEVTWGHSSGCLKLGQRPFDIWCHL